MFCTKCGAELANDAQFCTKCGEKTSIKNADSIKDNNEISNVQKLKSENHKTLKTSSQKEVNKNVKILIPMVAVIAILLVVIVKLAAGKNGTSGGGLFASKKNDDKADLSTIAEECPECGAAIETLLDLEEMGLAFGFNETKMKEAEKNKYNQMHHNCSADTINVENKLYTYKCAVGLYSGEWKGAGPSGKGSFVGTIRNSDRMVSYDGDWAYGLPEGKGTLFIDKYQGDYDMTYQGDMVMGMRHGTGLLIESVTNKQYFDDYYIAYEETIFANDTLTRETFFTKRDYKTDEDLAYGIASGDGNGNEYLACSTWKPGELSPREKNALENAEAMLALGVLGWVCYDGLTSWDKSEAKQWMDEWKAGCEADVVTWRQQQDEMKLDLIAKEANANAYAAARNDYEKASYQLGEDHFKTKELKNRMNFYGAQVK